uniref:Piezo non-specific cation channel R-Ras-binding domain-containing protein n=1 Tax=Eutreptiella gymnastica TaxID=73025 RepID=A0A7S1I0S6_9EUGL
MFQFLLSYTDWLCFMMFVYNTIYFPSLFIILLTASTFCYALLVTPHNFYWEAAVVYVESVIGLKAFALVMQSANKSDGFFPRAILHFCSHSGSFQDMSSDLILIVLIVLHKSMLRWGIWYVGDDMERTRVIRNPSKRNFRRQPGIGTLLAQVCRRMGSWFRRRVSMEDKLGKDLYMVEFFFEGCFFTTLLFSYYSLVGSDSDLVSSIQTNLIPGALVLWQAFLFLLITINRVVYLFRSLPMKLVLHYFNTILLIFGCLWFWNAMRRREPPRADFTFRCQLLIALKSLQLACSAQQIKYGYARIACNRLTDEYTDFKYYIYILFRVMPFVVEVKSILDWTFTRTTLKLWYWLKLEDIHHELLVARADIEDTKYHNRRVGAPFPAWPKCKSGLCFFLLIMMILFMPLLWYASFSPALTYNYVNVTSVEVAFEASPALFKSEVVIPQEQLRNEDTVQVGSWIQKMHPVLARHMLDEENSVQIISLTGYSQTLWDISTPARKMLLHRLSSGSGVSLVITTTVTRVRGFGKSVNRVKQTWPIPKDKYRDVAMVIDRAKSHVNEVNESIPTAIELNCFYSPFLFNSPLSVQRYTLDPDDAPCSLMANCMLSFEDDEAFPGRQYANLQCRSLFQNGNGNGIWPPKWSPEEQACISHGDQCPNYDSADNNDQHPWAPLYFVVTSAKAPFYQGAGFLASVGIMTLSSTFVFTLARVLRWLLTGQAYRVPLEDMKDPTRLIQLVEDIKLARAEGDLMLEEQLYKELIHIYQSTELLKYWSRLDMQR